MAKTHNFGGVAPVEYH